MPGIIEAWLKADETAPRKQQHTGKRVYDRLVEEYQFKGSYRRVLEVVPQFRQKPKEVYLPLAFEPGEMAQVDWNLRVVIAGKPCKVQVLNLVLNYSGKMGHGGKIKLTERFSRRKPGVSDTLFQCILLPSLNFLLNQQLQELFVSQISFGGLRR